MFYYRHYIKRTGLFKEQLPFVLQYTMEPATAKCHYVFEMKNKSNIYQTSANTKHKKHPWALKPETIELLTNIH